MPDLADLWPSVALVVFFLINFICFRCSGDQFLALLALGHAFDSNNMVVGSRGHLNTCRTLRKGFSGLNLVIDSSRGLFWVNIWVSEGPGINFKLFLAFRSCIYQQQHG